MSTAQPTPVDEHRRQLALALRPNLEDTFAGVIHELDDYYRDPRPIVLEDAANLLTEAAQKIRALEALAHG